MSRELFLVLLLGLMVVASVILPSGKQPVGAAGTIPTPPPPVFATPWPTPTPHQSAFLPQVAEE